MCLSAHILRNGKYLMIPFPRKKKNEEEEESNCMRRIYARTRETKLYCNGKVR